jgi:DNA-binding response OmpR family regulator
MRLLLVEDEARIAAFLKKGLSDQGYGVDHVETGAEALERTRDPELDLLILDLGLEDMDGLDVLRELRENGRPLPVIILTARGAVEDRVEGLNLGADDYLSKPFGFDELLARIRARLRSHGRGLLTPLEAGGIRLDIRRRRAEVGGRAVDLTDREFALLEAFLQRPGEVLSRRELLALVWDLKFDPGTNIVDVYISHLRRKVGEDRIETVRSMGYRFTVDEGDRALST